MANSYREYLKMKKYGGEGGDTPSPTLISKTINANGLYLPEDDQADGYNSVSVNVPEVSDIAFVPPQKFKSNGSNLEDYKIFGSDGVVIETETSVLPLTFTTTEDKLRDWGIRGNDDNGTENGFDYTAAQMLNCYVSAKGIVTYSSNDRGVIVPVQPSTTYTLVMTRCAKEEAVVDDAAAIATTTLPEQGIQGRVLFYATHGDVSQTFTTSADEHFVYFKFCNTTKSYLDEQLQSIMLVKGSTAPDHYIPYQQGVGERTVNLFDVGKLTDKVESGETLLRVENGVIYVSTSAASATTADGSNHTLRDVCGAIDADVPYTLKATSTGKTKQIYLYNAKMVWAFGETKTFSSANIESIRNSVILYYASGVSTSAEITNIMLVKGSTAPTTYVPFGYEIPISVNGTPQTFYIGSNPLTAGQSISKTSTGVDIATTEGENTISTTLYNKPETSVTYTESGVGEEVSGSYVIPVKINSTTTNVPIGDTPLMEDEYVNYGEQKIYRRILFMTYNDKHFITKDNKDFCLRRRGYNG